jgi:hypothetical protein
MKRCAKCRQDKGLERFYRNRGRPDGLDHYCKDCRRPYGSTATKRAWARRWRKTPQGQAAAKRQLRTQCERQKRSRRENPERWRAYANKRYRELYAPGAPRHVKRPPWRPKTEAQRLKFRATQARVKLRHSRKEDAKKKARERLDRPEIRQRNRDRAREYMRRRRHEDPLFRKKEAGRLMVTLAVKSGWLVKGPCRDCGTTDKVEAHHPDYDRPLDVIWLCPTHHLAEHHPHLRTAAEAAHDPL